MSTAERYPNLPPESIRDGKVNVCHIHTGGTISAFEQDGIISGHYDAKTFIDITKQRNPRIDKFFNIESYTPPGMPSEGIDSSNHSNQTMISIAHTIYKLMQEQPRRFAGYLVTSGTDTMAEAAQITALTLQNANVPIVFTGSAHPESAFLTESPMNFSQALDVCASDIRETCIVFAWNIYRAIATQKVSTAAADAFESPHVRRIGHLTHMVEIGDNARRRNKRDEGEIRFYPYLRGDIVPILMLAQLKYKTLRDLLNAKNSDGFVLEGFGAGNLPTQKQRDNSDQSAELPKTNDGLIVRRKRKEEENFERLFHNIVKKGKPVVVTPSCRAGDKQNPYDVTPGFVSHRDLIHAEAHPTSTAVTKLAWLMGLAKHWNVQRGTPEFMDFIRRGFKENFVGELTRGEATFHPSQANLRLFFQTKGLTNKDTFSS